MERLIERLRKIEALARSGIEGERENAQRMIDALCKKYGLTLEEIIESPKDWYCFSVKDATDGMLLTQVVVFICQRRNIKNTQSGKKRFIELTKTEAIDVRECFEYYRKIWRKQLEDFMIAFFHSNNIFGPPREENKDEAPEEAERIKRIVNLIQGIKSERWMGRRLLEDDHA